MYQENCSMTEGSSKPLTRLYNEEEGVDSRDSSLPMPPTPGSLGGSSIGDGTCEHDTGRGEVGCHHKDEKPAGDDNQNNAGAADNNAEPHHGRGTGRDVELDDDREADEDREVDKDREVNKDLLEKMVVVLKDGGKEDNKEGEDIGANVEEQAKAGGVEILEILNS
uniref:Uncharacterized protein n=1 Tax=Amphimedon queenslandica TaxID=400682 RepID=A0A1X7TV39_AMPQE